MKRSIKLSVLLDAVESETEEFTIRIDLAEGRVVMVENSDLHALGDEDEEEDLGALPDWRKEELKTAKEILEDDGSRFLDPPDKFEFHDYHQMERFIREVEDEDAAEQLYRAIKGKGAFRYFKDTAHRLGLLKSWYAYRDAALREFVIDWAEAKDLEVVDDMPKDEQQ